MTAKAKSDIIRWLTPGVASSLFVCIFIQITSDPMRSVKLLFDLKVASGDFPLGSMYLQLLVNHFYGRSEKQLNLDDVLIS